MQNKEKDVRISERTRLYCPLHLGSRWAGIQRGICPVQPKANLCRWSWPAGRGPHTDCPPPPAGILPPTLRLQPGEQPYNRNTTTSTSESQCCCTCCVFMYESFMGGFACLGTVYSNQNVRVKSWSNTWKKKRSNLRWGSITVNNFAFCQISALSYIHCKNNESTLTPHSSF